MHVDSIDEDVQGSALKVGGNGNEWSPSLPKQMAKD